MQTAAIPRWWFVVGACLVLGHAVLPQGILRDVVYVAIGALLVAATVVGIVRHRPARPAAWRLIAAGLCLWVLGDVMWLVFDHGFGIDPFPSVADAVYLLAYPLFAVGFACLSRSRSPGRDNMALIDAILVGTVVFTVLWVLSIGPAFESPETDFVAALVGAAYPLGDVIVLLQLVYLAGDTRFRSASLRMLACGFLATLVADVLFQVSGSLAWVGEDGAAVEPLWLVGYVLVALAALHPSMVRVAERQPPQQLDRRVGIGKLALLAVTLVLLPGTALYQWLSGDDPDSVELAGAGIVIIALALFRMVVMTRRMVAQADRLASLAEEDVLTGLPNLRRFSSEVTNRLGPTNGHHPVPVLLVVLDRFTEINDTLGHRVGDELLRAAAQRMRATVGDKGLVARIGGDSFGVVVHDSNHCNADATGCAAFLRQELVAPFTLSDVSVSIDALVGVAVGPDDGTSVEELLQRADVALSAARTRPERVARYSGRMSSDGALTPHLMTELSAGLDHGEIVVHYQPQVQVATGEVRGVEALVRWQHPVHGLLPPAAFIPAAERTGLIRPLTLYVLDRALAQAARWRSEGRGLTVSVNLSVRDLLDPDFVQDVALAIARYGLDTAALELEITETMAMVDPNRSFAVLQSLSDLGVVLAVDDYGTGYSSLAYLQRLPVQRLKIDRSFVTGMVQDAPSAAIVRSTIELARNLGMTVVAEGVEDDATLMTLREMRCGAAQGFGIGRPVPADRVPDLVQVIESRVPRVLRQAVPVGQRVI